MSELGKKKSVTLREVARDAGVSLATASFVLSGRGGTGSSGSEATKRKVRASAKKLGYAPNRYARAMRTGKSDAIVLALGTVSDPWGHQVAHAVRAAARPRKLSTVVLADDTWSEFLSGYASDAAFVNWVDSEPDAHERLIALARSGVQLVVYSEKLEADGFDVISSSASSAVARAYAHLRSRHERVALLARKVPSFASRPSYPSPAHAFYDAMLAQGDLPDDARSFLSAGTKPHEMMRYCRELLTSPDRPTAVVALDWQVATLLVRCATVLNVAVPHDLEIITIGPCPQDQFLDDTVSHYGVPNLFDRIAQIVVDRAVAGSSEPYQRHVFEWEFIEGTTTRGTNNPAFERYQAFCPQTVR